MKFRRNILIMVSSTIFLVACSTTSTPIKNNQQALVGEDVSFAKSSVFVSPHISKSKVRSKVFSKLTDKSLRDDPVVVNKVNEMIKLQTGNKDSLTSRLSLKGQLYSIFSNSSESGKRNIDKVFVHKKAWTHGVARVNYQPLIMQIENVSGNDANGANKISLNFTKVFTWGGAAKGQGEIVLKADYSTDNNGIKHYNFHVLSANAESAKVMGFKTVADISFDLAALRDILRSIQAEKSKQRLIENKSDYIANQIIQDVKRRYYTRRAYYGEVEEIYDISRDVAKSRLDRHTNIIRSGSSYVYIYKGSNRVEHNGESHKLKVRVKLELFPESNGRTAVVYQPRYEVIKDTISDKAVAGEKIGKQWAENEIAHIRNILEN